MSETIRDAILKAEQGIKNGRRPDWENTGKYCFYCQKTNHNDSECSSTRPGEWHPTKYTPRPYWVPEPIIEPKKIWTPK